jgi:rod shape-determining protein MreB
MKIGIDLGTANILVYVKGKGVVLNEPSVVAINDDDNRLVAVGEEAREMIGRTPGNVRAIRPMRDGVIADYVITEAMLRYFIQRVCGRFGLFKPDVMVCIPAGVTRRAAGGHARRSTLGRRQAWLIQEPLAAAIGARIPIHCRRQHGDRHRRRYDDAAVISARRHRRLDVRARRRRQDGRRHHRRVKRKRNLMVGSGWPRRSGQIGSALPLGELSWRWARPDRRHAKRSRSVNPRLSPTPGRGRAAARGVLEQTPPELASDVIDKGIVLTGGGALLRNLDRLLTLETGVPCYVAEDPLACVAIGAGIALERIEVIKRNLLNVGSTILTANADHHQGGPR